jgi:hypothetical protein
MLRQDLRRGGSSIHAWHVDVHQNEIWFEPAHRLECLGPGRRLANETESGRGPEHRAGGSARQNAVVNDQHAVLPTIRRSFRDARSLATWD